MTILSTRVFGGEVPRVPADKLPEGKAQQAINCDFAYGELRGLKGLFQVTTLANAAKSVFSLDGLQFFSWPYRTKAWKGPVTNDSFNRVYYTSESGGLRVTQTSFMQINGGEPSVSYKVGVPPVTTAPTYRFSDKTSFSDFPNVVVKLYSFYDANGKRYDEKEITPVTEVKKFREYAFTVAEPTTAEGDPTTLSTEYLTLNLTSLTYRQAYQTIQGDGGVEVTSYSDTVVNIGGAAAVLTDASTVVVGGTVYTGVASITPVAASPTTPGEVLAGKIAQVGGATPTAATLGVRFEFIDTTKNTTVLSLTASSTTASPVSDAVPGGVEAALVKNGTDVGAWKVVLTWGVIEYRSYVITVVNNWNEESKPSPPVVAAPTYLDVVNLSFTLPSLAGYVPGNRYRVYRSTSDGSYLSCTDAPVAASGSSVTFTDTVGTIANTDAVLESVGWDLPPSSLKGLTLLPNGFLAGFSGDTLYMSEPYRPWAWPYAMTFPISLVGMRAIESSLVVTTVSYPYLVSGVHPDAMTQAQLTASQAGISDHGMAVVGNTVAYISNDGLAIVNGYNVDLSTSQQLWTREVWKSKFGAILNDLELAYHDGSLVCGTATGAKMWEIRLDTEGGGNLSMLSSAFTSAAMYVVPASDQLYLVQTNKLMQYKGLATSPGYDWWSKEHILLKPTVFTVGYINTNGPCTVSVYADGALWHQQTLYAPGYFRMPSSKKALRWSYRLQGTGYVKELSIAERRQELIGV